ncbi:TPA: 50S ribosomal protein L22 [Campylobacter jejuni]|nr:50S ribosomal protein L22 [Campylobacter jejuni]
MSKALIKFIRLSPTKARLIAREVQGMNAELAMASLKFMPNKGAKYIANAISSAVANGGFEANEVVVKSCRVDAAAVLKRFRPRARGRSASRIRKPTSHILVEVAKAEVKAEEKKTVAKKAPAAKKTTTTKAPAKKTTSTKKATAKKES